MGALSSKQPLLTEESSLVLGAMTSGELTVSGSATFAGVDVTQALNGKQDAMSTIGGAGSSLLEGNLVRQLYGHGGIDVATNLNLVNPNDPEHRNIRISGEALQSQIAQKQDQLTSSSSVVAGSLACSLFKAAPEHSNMIITDESGVPLLTVSEGARAGATCSSQAMYVWAAL